MASLPRPKLEALVQSLIDHLDEIDGDADLEDGGDAEPVEYTEA